MELRYCTKCGEGNGQESNYCSKCGTKINSNIDFKTGEEAFHYVAGKTTSIFKIWFARISNFVLWFICFGFFSQFVVNGLNLDSLAVLTMIFLGAFIGVIASKIHAATPWVVALLGGSMVMGDFMLIRSLAVMRQHHYYLGEDGQVLLTAYVLYTILAFIAAVILFKARKRQNKKMEIRKNEVS